MKLNTLLIICTLVSPVSLAEPHDPFRDTDDSVVVEQQETTQSEISERENSGCLINSDSCQEAEAVD
ncbi:hypothetical protein KCM76_09140 [Zooshikella marina]|uniref:hypothetical protein n=1 Tax=Zooshikella ganghwensis TaxID=202772 RepID=UPI001BAF5075|nr:hypothetical protein [Zooshikella ganghwensis]MBU2706149.1 hypothetical protein [Zooshikella ganghwensis]